MSTFYAEMAALVTELLTEYGALVHLRRATPGTFDPVAGAMSGATSADLESLGLFVSRQHRLVRDTLVEGTERVCVIDASVVPLMSDQLVAGGTPWAIVKIDPIEPVTGQPIAYFVQVKH
jgi:hypothetical protein